MYNKYEKSEQLSVPRGNLVGKSGFIGDNDMRVATVINLNAFNL